MEKKVVVRFAPSPTGYLHIGGARTAIFNWLYARKTGGKFILRIEDTDAERSTEDSIEGIMDGLKWLGLAWDEGPDFQSRHLEAHMKAAQSLLKSGHAYKCFCTKEILDGKRDAAVKSKQTYLYDGTCRHLTAEEISQKEAEGLSFTIRLKIPEGEGAVEFDDAVYGRIEKKYSDLEDFIIVRSNGKPLYILSNAVDDIRDAVTHIIRGQDGLANTPKQVLLYEALAAPLPVFAHMSLTLDPKKAKISKRRHGEMVAIHYYRENGFLPWAMVNFLVLLGWATPESKEIFSRDELIEAFALEGISRANSVFNINQDDPRFFTDPKALNMNAHYLRTMPVAELIPYIREWFEKEGVWDNAWDGERQAWFEETIDLIRSRYYLLTDFTEKGQAYFADEFPMEPEAVEKNILSRPELESCLPEVARQVGSMEEYTEKSVELLLREMIKSLNIKAGILVNAIRVAVTGQSKGPDFIKSLVAVGQKRVADRLAKAAKLF